MGFFSRLFGTKVNDSLPGSGYTFRLGGSTSGAMVNQRSAMQISAVYACVRVLAESVAGLPLHVYEYGPNRSKEKAYDSDLYFLLHDEPNPEMTSFVFRETMMTHLLLWGNAYAQIIRDGRGKVTALYPLMPDRMRVDRDENGQLYYRYQLGTDESHLDKPGTVDLSPKDVLHIPALGFDGLVGYSPIAMARNSIGMAIACEDFGASFFKNGAAPSGVLEHPGVLKNPEKLRAAWDAQYGGSRNSGRVAVLEEGMKFNPITIPPEQAQFLETRKFQIDEIARIFRIPPHMIGDLERSTFSNIEQQSLEFVQYTLNPWICRWEQSLTKALLSREEQKKYSIDFNVNGLLRGDYQSRMAGYATARQSGWLTANEIRATESMNLLPPEIGDKLLCNGNMIDVSTIGTEKQPASQNTTQGGSNSKNR